MPLDMKDAWFAAFRLPNFFRRLLGEGALSSSFIPIYMGLSREQREKDLKELIDGVFTLLITAVSLICLVCFIFMDPLIHTWLSGPGFSDVPGKLEMTITMARIMIFFLFFITLFAYLMALLNSEKKFTLTGFAPLFLNIGIIAGLWGFRDSSHFVEASAWAVVVGVALQVLILLPAVYTVTGLPRLTRSWKKPAVKKVLVKFFPTFFGVSVLQVLGLVNGYFVSQLAPGGLTYIHVADRLLELPLSLIAVSIGTTLLPTLAGYWAHQQTEQFARSLSKHLSLFFFLGIPSTFGLWFMGADIADVLFKRGEFSAQDVIVVGTILKIYGITLLAAGSLKITNQALYAVGDTMTPALISVGGLVIHLILAPYLMKSYQLNGLVFSTAFITVVNALLCVGVLHFKVVRLHWMKIAGHFFNCLVASSLMGLYLNTVNQWSWKQGRFILDFPILLILISGAGLIYFLAGYFLKIEELDLFMKRFKRK